MGIKFIFINSDLLWPRGLNNEQSHKRTDPFLAQFLLPLYVCAMCCTFTNHELLLPPAQLTLESQTHVNGHEKDSVPAASQQTCTSGSSLRAMRVPKCHPTHIRVLALPCDTSNLMGAWQRRALFIAGRASRSGIRRERYLGAHRMHSI